MNLFNKKKFKVQSAKFKVKKNFSIFNFQFSISNSSSGFTLVETLVAITILMIAIAGPLTVAEKGLSAAIYARDQLIGSYLAQDGMEYIKNVVDNNELSLQSGQGANINNYWLYERSAPSSQYQINDLTACTSGDPCTLDTQDGGIAQCTSSSPCTPLYLTTCGYVQNSGEINVCVAQNGNDTENFTRSFYVQPFNTSSGDCSSDPSTCNAANVVVTVTWPGDVTGGGGVTLEDTLFDTPVQ